MTQRVYVVEGRQFRTINDYNCAMHDKKMIDRLRSQLPKMSIAQAEQLSMNIQNGKYPFYTLLGQDFAEEIDEMLQERKKAAAGEKKTGIRKTALPGNKPSQVTKSIGEERKLDSYVEAELRRQERRRRQFMMLCGLTAVVCLGYFGIYSYQDYRTRSTYEELSQLKESPTQKQEATAGAAAPVIHYTKEEAVSTKEVLDEYKSLVNKNKKLIGWVKIDDTNIDYPVMQTSDNEYYLDHNLNQEYDKNGSIFMDKDCDVGKPSTNYILYGHHMKNGSMFGNLHLYSSQSYYEKHKYIEFDTIYEKGTYEIMYVFRSKVYKEDEIVFKYYQFIDAASEQEFDSNMREMAALAMYDTGVTAQYGDRLLTLSTCDYQEKDGRFVVVAKKVTKE